MQEIDPVALFRLSVLGPLVSREQLARGELQQVVAELASREYVIPGSQRRLISAKTIHAWYYAWRHRSLEGLTPKTRADRGRSKIAPEIQEAILAAKRDNPRRSIRQIIRLLEAAGTVPRGSLSRSAIHRLLQAHDLSRIAGSASLPEERRSFVAQYAGSIWYGDVLHGPRLRLDERFRKTYLASLFDDAARLVAHGAWGLGETAVDIEAVLKQAVLRRGVPRKLVVDQGAAYRSASLQGICARLGIQLVYCRPYTPEGKGKIERWHRTLRDQFLSELDVTRIHDLADLNARFWAWVEQVYHRTPHEGLGGVTPLERYQQDLPRIRTLGARAAQLDAIFQHRVARFVRKDGTVSYAGNRFEVPYELAGKTVQLVVDPHAAVVCGVEDEHGKSLGAATPLDPQANAQRQRRKPQADVSPAGVNTSANLVELAFDSHYGQDQKKED